MIGGERSRAYKILVGYKCDKSDRIISKEEGQKLADEFNMSFFETSAKNNQNVNEVFNFLAQQIYKEIVMWSVNNNKKIEITKQSHKKEGEKRCLK